MRLHTFFAAMVAFSCIFCAVAFAGILTSKELIEDATTLDGTIVSYKGEAVTAIMKRGDHSWINLNDGYNAIGIWCRTESLNDVKWLGNYKNEGDTVVVTGLFHRACPEHGGELDIHADTLSVEASGFPVHERIPSQRINLATVFFILTLVSIFILRKRL